ncbi:MAG TPA: HTTM domain-containing protein [Polyangia bacterium]|jgi:hypothetical protein|nr:HTTM domain-containing protein [Polyangia bacterium]
MKARAFLGRLIQPIDARAPALFRIAIGVVTAVDFADRLRDAFTFYSSQGLLAPDAELVNAPLSLLAFGSAPSPARVVCFFIFGFVAITCFTLGYRTRLATVATWAIVYAIQLRNRAIGDGGDTLLRVLLFWALFIDLGGRFSLDVIWRRRPPQATVPGLPVRLLRLQIALVYLFAGLSKTGASWLNGSAVYYAVQSVDFGRPFGSWLAAHPTLARVFGFGTLAAELGFAPLVSMPLRWPVFRALGLTLGLGLHVGIALTMRVGIFSWVLPASYAIYLSPRWIDALVRRRDAIVPSGDPFSDSRLPTPVSRSTAALWAILGLQMTAVVCQLVLGKDRGNWVPGVYAELAALGMSQGWTMFSPEPPKRLNRFSATGTLTDGQSIDVLAAAAPMLLPAGGVVYSRWYKYRSDLARTRHQDLAIFGRYICRRYNDQTSGAKLRRFTLTLYWRDIPAPGSKATSDWEHANVLEQPCLADSP